MNKKINIAIIGLGQIGNFLYNEIKTKKKKLKLKLIKKSKLLQFQQKISKKKEILR